MTFETVRKGLDFVVSLAVLAAVVLLMRTHWPTEPTTGRPPEVPIYAVGEPLGPINGVRMNGSRPALLLHLQSNCRFCTASMPFYSRLEAMPDRPHLVVLGYESRDRLESYVRSHGFEPDQIVTVAPGTLKTSGTPTLVLAGTDGIISGVWRGQLSPDEEAAVLVAVSQFGGPIEGDER